MRDIEVDGPVTTASFSPAGVNGWYLSPTITISADDGWGVRVKDGSIEYWLDGGDWKAYTSPFQVTAPNAHTLDMRAADTKGNTATHSTTFNVYDLDTPVDGSANAAVPATLSLTLGAPASFGAFTPGVDKSYAATTSANVISTAGDATLRVADPSANARGRLVNGAFSLSDPLEAAAGSGTFAPVGAGLSLLTYAGPISNDAVAMSFRQHIAAGQALRTGSYSKTLTFTLSMTSP